MSTNYSKWDKFAREVLSDSENSDTSESEQQGFKRRPKVTRLEQPSTIRIDSQGSTILTQQSQQLHPEPMVNEVLARKANSSAEDTLADLRASSSSKERTPASVTRLDEFTMNGGDTGRFLWSQSREEVVIRCQVSTDLKASDVVVIYQDDPPKRFEGERPWLGFTTKHGSDILSGHLQFDIVPNDPKRDDCLDSPVDWELKAGDDGNRYLEVTLRKNSPIPGAVFWWKNVFVGDGEIDLSNIQGRIGSTLSGSLWQAAHQQFQQNLRDHKREPVSVD